MHFSKVPTESDVADHVFKKHCYGTEKPRGLKSVGKPGWKMATVSVQNWSCGRQYPGMSPPPYFSLCPLWH